MNVTSHTDVFSHSMSCDSEDDDIPPMDGTRRRSLIPPTLSRTISDDNANIERTSIVLENHCSMTALDQVDFGGRRMSNSCILALKSEAVREKLRVANGNAIHRQLSKEAELEKDTEKHRSMCQRTRWKQFFLFLSLIYLILAIICHYFALPALRRIALQREAITTNFTSASTMLMATYGVAYQDLQTAINT